MDGLEITEEAMANAPDTGGITIKHWLWPIIIAVAINVGSILVAGGQLSTRVDNLQMAIKSEQERNDKQVDKDSFDQMRQDVREIRQLLNDQQSGKRK